MRAEVYAETYDAIVCPTGITPLLHTLYAINAICVSSLDTTISIGTTQTKYLEGDALLDLLSHLQSIINHFFLYISPA